MNLAWLSLGALVVAMIVASIETVWAGLVTPPKRTLKAVRYDEAARAPIHLDKGAEMGRFKLGSTVILLFGPEQVRWAEQLGPLSPVCMGESLGQAFVEKIAGDAESANPVSEGRVGRPDAGEGEARARRSIGQSGLVDEEAGDALRADLVQLVDDAKDSSGVVRTDAAVEALGELAVVDPQHELRDGQLREGVDDHQGQALEDHLDLE